MFYVKNVFNRERIRCLIIWAMALVFAVMNWGTSGMVVAVGIMGAMVGRKIDKKR